MSESRLWFWLIIAAGFCASAGFAVLFVLVQMVNVVSLTLRGAATSIAVGLEAVGRVIPVLGELFALLLKILFPYLF